MELYKKKEYISLIIFITTILYNSDTIIKKLLLFKNVLPTYINKKRIIGCSLFLTIVIFYYGMIFYKRRQRKHKKNELVMMMEIKKNYWDLLINRYRCSDSRFEAIEILLEKIYDLAYDARCFSQNNTRMLLY